LWLGRRPGHTDIEEFFALFGDLSSGRVDAPYLQDHQRTERLAMLTIIGVILTLCMLDGPRRLLDWAVWNPLKKHSEKVKSEAKERMEAIDARSREGWTPDPEIDEYCRLVGSTFVIG
jgi:hypothetical protein